MGGQLKISRSAYGKVWRAANSDYISGYMKVWRAENRPHLLEYNKQWWYALSPNARLEKSRRKAPAAAMYRRSHPGKYSAYAMKRRAALLRAIPRWADLVAIQRFYEARPAGMHVDHIVPLRGGTVCGLHVENNLRYLPRIDNIRRPRRYAE